ncbi:hypothetical protein [Pseudomonas sp. CGJS7]|uniref:hypothetical protein n=1 Tax=Pseudomonas sp. CGJS7 TaxID=3109348 RepID=UPI0030085CAD
MPRKPDPTPAREGVVMTVDAFKTLFAFHQELHGIVRTLQPEVLSEVGYAAGHDPRLLRDVFHALARRLDPVLEACAWTPDGEGDGGIGRWPAASRRVH